MAEAYPEDVPQPADDHQDQFPPDDSQNPISVLVLATKWQFDTYGISTINRSLVNNLRVVDPEAKKIKITCAVVEEDGKISDEQRKDAEKHKVELKGAKQPRGPKKKPNIEWLDNTCGAYYHHLIKTDTYDFIIGHVPYLANGCFNFRELCQIEKTLPRIILVVHSLPKTEDGSVDEDELQDWLKEADVVFSVGQVLESEITSYITGLEPKKRPTHKMYIPAYPVELLSIQHEAGESNRVKVKQNITMMTGEKKDLDVSGLDFPLAVTSTVGASEHNDFTGVRTNLVMLAARREDTEEWKRHFNEILKEKNVTPRGLTFQLFVPENTETLKSQMRKSNLFIFPSKYDSPVFGSEALGAIAAGVPILVSRYCGLASQLQKIAEHNEPVVCDIQSQSDVKTWKERIIQKIVKPEDSRRKANRLREQLLLDTSIASTHLGFISTVTDVSCVNLKMELDTDCVVPREHLEAATKFGVELGSVPINAQTYIVAFLQKLLLQREKLDKDLLVTYLKPEIPRMWQEFISILENKNRKLLDVKKGCLIFLLFSPTEKSSRQLKDESWANNLILKMEKLLELLGVEAKIRMRPDYITTVAMEKDRLPRLRELKLRHTAESETHSEGYETMTQISSKSEVFPAGWLGRQPRVETIKADHITGSFLGLMNNTITLSESGSIAIASPYGKPSLSVIHAGTDKLSSILSDDKQYWSACFIKTLDKEYLAGTCHNEGTIRLWDVENNTSQVVYGLDKGKMMNLCMIDERTVACGEVNPSADGICRIHILNTDTEKWSLGSNLMTEGMTAITGMCHLKTENGTSCLLLCCAINRIIQAVEMFGGRIRWKADEHQMSKPWNICSDDNTVYVADLSDKLHLLSGSDGAVITSINLQQYGIIHPIDVRLRDDVLYILHRNIEKRDQYSVSKLTKPIEIF